MLPIHKVKTYSIAARKSKVALKDFAKAPCRGKSFCAFLDSLPRILKGRDLRAVAEAIVRARKHNKAVVFMAGAHVIKCGLNPVVIELLKKKVITCIAFNGAGIIHDFELSLQAKTSEDVGEALRDGRFGMGRETAEFLNSAAKEGVSRGLGLGYAVAEKIHASRLKHKELSILCQAYRLGVPVCVFPAIGTDIIHQHPSFDAALTAEGSLRDFHRFTEELYRLHRGGVVLNFGSAVILPEVFLKALNLARNLGKQVKDFTTANFDMFYQYRPSQNIVSRPVMAGGKGYYIIGHHEIMLPLLAQAVIERL